MLEKIKNIFTKTPIEQQTAIKTFILERFYTFNGEGDTIGVLSHNGKLFSYALERPLIVNGKQNGSDNNSTAFNESCCIPAGEYFADFTLSNRFKIKLYCLLGTGIRQGIRIHAGNTIMDSEGCILLGKRIIKNVRHKGKTYPYFLESSKATIDEFHKLCNGEKIKIIIKDLPAQEIFNKFKFE
jgi:hypothetical protein